MNTDNRVELLRAELNAKQDQIEQLEKQVVLYKEDARRWQYLKTCDVGHPIWYAWASIGTDKDKHADEMQTRY